MYQSKHIKVSATAQHQKLSNIESKVKKNAAVGATLLGTGVLVNGFVTVVSADTANPGTVQASATKDESQINQAALSVIRGELGNGVERIQNLSASGFDATVVQNRVNEFYADWSKVGNAALATSSLNPAPAVTETPVSTALTEDQINQLALRVIRGELGNGAARIQNLTAAGYDVTAVQNRVNELLSTGTQAAAASPAAESASTSTQPGWNISDPQPNTDFPNDPYPWGQCTWYVYGRAAQLGISFSTQMGNAGDWMYASDYTVTQTPQKHAALSFLPGQAGADGTYGHVAFVEDVRADGSILVSESNAQGLGVVSYRSFTAEEAKQFHYVIGKTQIGLESSKVVEEAASVTNLAQNVRYIK